mgnify:CR=1 FL=1
MKILQLNFEKGWRGGERQTLYCMRAFRKAGHEVEVMCREGAPLAERARQEGFIAHTCRNVPGQLAFLSGAGRYDIVHAQTANTITWAVLTKWLHRRPVAFSRRTSFAVKPGDEWKTGFKWRHADLFVAISEMAAGEPRRLGIEPVIIRSAVEPHRIDAENVAGLVREFDLDGKKVMATSAALIRDKDLRTWFPIEYRYVKADDIPLSMFEGRDSCSISVHQHYSMDHHNFFAAVEPIFWKYAGRPHWGKLHGLNAHQLQGLYPRWKAFAEVRQALDPRGRFLNAHLSSILGVT